MIEVTRNFVWWRLGTRLLIACSVLCTLARAQEEQVALRGGKLLTVSHGTIVNGVVIMENGKITAVGPVNQTGGGPR